MNNIVTRGYGTSSRIVTRGYGTILDEIVDKAIEVARRVGGSAKDVASDLKEKYIIVRAALVEVNDQRIDNVKGIDKGHLSETSATVVAKVLISRVYKGLKEIFIRATNIRSNRRRRE